MFVVLQCSGITCSDILAGESIAKPSLSFSSVRSSSSAAGGMFKFSVADPLEVRTELSVVDEEDTPKARGLEAHIGAAPVKKNVDTVTRVERPHHEAIASHVLSSSA